MTNSKVQHELQFKVNIEAERYYATLARQGLHFHEALGELIDNSISARRPPQNGVRTNILVEINIEETPTGCNLVVADIGTGIRKDAMLKGKVFNLGADPTKPGEMNEHGIGLKNALCTLTRGNQTDFSLRTFTEEDGHFEVKSPLRTVMDIEPSDWEHFSQGLRTINSLPSGTCIRVEVPKEVLQTIYQPNRQDSNFSTLMTRLGERLGVTYRRFIDLGDVLKLSYKAMTGTWIERTIPAIQVPHANYKKDTITFTDHNGEERSAVYIRSANLDYSVKQADAEMSRGWPYPLKIHYQGSNARCGLDIVVRNRVVMSYQFETLFPETNKTVDYNRFTGEIIVGPEFRTNNNKTGIDVSDPLWRQLLTEIGSNDSYGPEAATRVHSEKTLQKEVKGNLEGIFPQCVFREQVAVFGGAGKIDILQECDAGRTVYELKTVTANALDIYQLQMYWDGLVETGDDPTEGVLIARDLAPAAQTVLNSMKERKDASGKFYKMRFQSIESLHLASPS